MHTVPGLAVLGLVASYYLRVLAAYLICVLVSRTCFQPRTRFAVWVSFLIGSGAYWIFLVARGLASLPDAGLAEPKGWADGLVTAASLSVPSEWSYGVNAINRILAGVYGIGLVILLFVMLQKHVRLRLLLRRAAPGPRELDGIFCQLCREFALDRCRLRVLRGITSPATAYVLRPRILLPELFGDYLDGAQLRDVLTHELVHVARRDYLWAVVCELIRDVLFFHPAIWMASRSLSRERELACDAAVIRHRQDRRPDYAECLTRVARMRLAEERSRAAISLATSGSFLALRVRALLAENKSRSWWKRGAAVAVRLALLAIFLAVWPGLAIVLRYAPPAVNEVLRASNYPTATHHHPQRHRRTRVGHRPLSANTPALSGDNNALRVYPLSTVTVPGSLRAARSTFHPVPDPPEMTTSNMKDGPSAKGIPEFPSDPVWNESSPVERSSASPSWKRTAIGVAATLGRAITLGGGGSDQEGNH